MRTIATYVSTGLTLMLILKIALITEGMWAGKLTPYRNIAKTEHHAPTGSEPAKTHLRPET